MADSSIEWTDKVWNPVTGCTKVSAGCANCYAARMAHRGFTSKEFAKGLWYQRPFENIQTHEKRMDQPRHWKKPRRIFVNSMSDLFHEQVPDGFIKGVLGVATDCGRHTFQILTKRPKRMVKFFGRWAPTPNIWLGVSVENQKTADERISLLLQTHASIRFLSVEPMIEKIDLGLTWRQHAHQILGSDKGIGWVIVGGESGPGARPFNVEWARDILAQCRAADVPCFIKQLGAKPFREEESIVSGHTLWGIYPKIKLKSRKGSDMSEWPEDLRVRVFPRVTT